MSRADEDAAPPGEMAARFRGFLPVVIDVETGGFDARRDALLEIGATLLDFNDHGHLQPQETLCFAVEPFPGANIERSALDFTGIDPDDPERQAVPEGDALRDLFQVVRRRVRAHGCKRAVLVGHNASFDLGFVFAAAERAAIKRNPFHPFSTFDTVSLSALAYGQTVLASACQAAGIEFDNSAAHRASYDSEKTAALFCEIVNRWFTLGGWSRSLP